MFSAPGRNKLIFGFRFICQEQAGYGRVAQPRCILQDSIENWKMILSALDQQVQNFTGCFLPRVRTSLFNRQAFQVRTFRRGLQGALSVSNELGLNLLTLGFAGHT
jgi:hypothetical protein